MGIAMQWVHVLALMGDTSDNVPGVPGVGAKGALSLIQEYGTVESVLENADKVHCGAGVYIMPKVAQFPSCVADAPSKCGLWPSGLHLQPSWEHECPTAGSHCCAAHMATGKLQLVPRHLALAVSLKLQPAPSCGRIETLSMYVAHSQASGSPSDKAVCICLGKEERAERAAQQH